MKRLTSYLEYIASVQLLRKQWGENNNSSPRQGKEDVHTTIQRLSGSSREHAVKHKIPEGNLPNLILHSVIAFGSLNTLALKLHQALLWISSILYTKSTLWQNRWWLFTRRTASITIEKETCCDIFQWVPLFKKPWFTKGLCCHSNGQMRTSHTLFTIHSQAEETGHIALDRGKENNRHFVLVSVMHVWVSFFLTRTWT